MGFRTDSHVKSSPLVQSPHPPHFQFSDSIRLFRNRNSNIMPVTHANDDYSFAPAIPSPPSVSVTHYSKIVNENPDTTLYRSRYSHEESSDAAYQLDLQKRWFQVRKRRVVMVSIATLSFCMIAILIRVNNFLSGMNLPSFTIRIAQSHDAMALRDSNGFFIDVPDENWKLRMQQTKTILDEQDIFNQGASATTHINAREWWVQNWKPNFPCYHEVRIRNKFICDPNRIISRAVEYLNSSGRVNVGSECIIYVSGGDDIAFANQFLDYTLARVVEVGLTTPICEVHVFQPNIENQQPLQRDNFNIHPWGFKSKHNAANTTLIDASFKTFEETIQVLGHTDKTLSLLALDCEGCEFDVYNDLLSLDIPVRQLLIQMHVVPNPNQVHSMLNSLRFAGYVITHKEEEPNGSGEVYNFSFLKLSRSYFD